MRKDEILRDTGWTPKQFRHALNVGVILPPYAIRHAGQLSADWEYKPDTIERMEVIESVSPRWMTVHKLDYAAGAEELLLVGYDLASVAATRHALLRWASAFGANFVGQRKSVLSIPLNARSPGWETKERRSIARSVDRALPDVPGQLRDLTVSDMQKLSGVFKPTATIPWPVDTRGSLDREQDHIRHAPDAEVLEAVRNALDVLAAGRGELERGAYMFLAMPEGTHLDDLARVLLAQVGHVCKTRHTFLQALFPFFSMKMLTAGTIMGEMAANPEEYEPDLELRLSATKEYLNILKDAQPVIQALIRRVLAS
jgi:hypothetical protein